MALLLYLALAIAAFGRFALAGGGTIGVGPDVQIFLWGLRFWPAAVAHGLDPLGTSAVWPPQGADVLWSTTVPLLSLLVAPVTLTAGPATAFNLLCILAPVTSAGAAYGLCRELTGRWGPALVGGALYGFSACALAESTAHLQLTTSFAIPLGAWLVLRRWRGRLTDRALSLSVGGLVVVEFLISPEVLVTMILVGLVAAALGWRMAGERRRDAAAIVRSAGRGGLAGGLIVAPLIGGMLAHPAALPNGTIGYSVDLLNLVVPTPITRLGGTWAAPLTARFAGNLAEQTGYLGVPLLGLVGVAAWRGRQRAVVRLATAILLVAVLLSLGSWLTVAGARIVPLPGALLSFVPLVRDAMPARLAIYSALAAAVVVSDWLSHRPGRPLIVGLVLAAVVVSLAPTSRRVVWWRATPSALAGPHLGRLAELLPAGSRVLGLPAWDVADRSLEAQADLGLRFSLIDDWLQVMPPGEARRYRFLLTLDATVLDRLSPSSGRRLERRLCRTGIDRIIAWRVTGRGLDELGLAPVRAGDAVVYRLPGCGRSTTAVTPGDGPGV